MMNDYKFYARSYITIYRAASSLPHDAASICLVDSLYRILLNFDRGNVDGY